MGCGSSKSTQTSSRPAKEEQTQHTVVEESAVPKGTPKAYMVTEGNGGNSQPVNSANNDKQNLVPENAECSSVESSVNTKEAIKKDFGNVEIENVSKANSDLECSSVTSLTAERNADKVEAETKPAENNGAAEEPKPVEEEAKAEGSDEKAATEQNADEASAPAESSTTE
ncbi:hypothetical protein EB796_011307 [Bugula neritina]|uniref:Uncharacterized protein n=1 Tax=Bugula neritina TaxID=10212 RepID=A0A7J7JVG0_BUGNE|nr:hypothetical protein EB796_011307 [Bugula neritina]